MISLINMQYFQELHDKRYHIDIYSKPLVARISHLHQHLVKYNSSDIVRMATYHDALACVLSMANALNFSISDGYLSFDQVVDNLNNIRPIWHKDNLERVHNTSIARIAKILEGNDHLESIDYKKNLQTEVLTIFNVLVQRYKDDLDLTSLSALESKYVSNIFELKTKSIFYAQYHALDKLEPIYQSFLAYNTVRDMYHKTVTSEHDII